MQEILDQGKIFDKQVELQVAERREASLSEVAVLILDHYLSQRDIWHLHAAMMQDGGQILYANFDYMLRQLVPNSRIDRLISMATNEPVLSGLVDHGTEVSFKSTTANMVVLVQISSELFEYGLMGRPYWEALHSNDHVHQNTRSSTEPRCSCGPRLVCKAKDGQRW